MVCVPAMSLRAFYQEGGSNGGGRSVYGESDFSIRSFDGNLIHDCRVPHTTIFGIFNFKASDE